MRVAPVNLYSLIKTRQNKTKQILWITVIEMQRKRAEGMLRAALLLVDFEGDGGYLQPCTCVW